MSGVRSIQNESILGVQIPPENPVAAQLAPQPLQTASQNVKSDLASQNDSEIAEDAAATARDPLNGHEMDLWTMGDLAPVYKLQSDRGYEFRYWFEKRMHDLDEYIKHSKAYLEFTLIQEEIGEPAVMLSKHAVELSFKELGSGLWQRRLKFFFPLLRFQTCRICCCTTCGVFQ